MISRWALVRYPVAGTPTEVRQIDVLAGGDVAGFASSPDSCREHSIGLEAMLVMVLVVMNGAHVQLTCACTRLSGTVLESRSLDALSSIDVSLAAIKCVAWPLVRH
jgi:hypothetical protein